VAKSKTLVMIGKKVQAAREAKGLSQKDLADLTTIYATSTIEKLEQGTYQNYQRCLESCAKCLNVPLADLLVSTELPDEAADLMPPSNKTEELSGQVAVVRTEHVSSAFVASIDVSPVPPLSVDQLASRFASITPTAQNLWSQIDPVMRNIAKCLDNFAASSREREIAARYLALLVDRLRIETSEMAHGQIVTDYADCSLLTHYVKSLSHGDELLGLTNWEVDKTWWMGADADDFLQANIQAIAQGATICRIFVCNMEDRELLITADKHVQMGIDVRIVLHSEAPPGTPFPRSQCVLRTSIGSTKRGWLAYHVELDNKSMPKYNVFSMTPNSIERLERALENLQKSARLWGTVQCEGVDAEECAPLGRECRPDQQVREGQNDGHRVYIHEDALFKINSSDSAILEHMYKAMSTVLTAKILHKFTYQGTDTDRLRMDKGLACRLNELVGRRWLGLSAELLRSLAFIPANSGSGRLIVTGLFQYTIHRDLIQTAFKPVIHSNETVVGTCYDRKYYTFATSHHAASRMFTDNLAFDVLRGYVRRGGDYYRDLTLIEAPQSSPQPGALLPLETDIGFIREKLETWYEEEIEDAIANAAGVVQDEQSKMALRDLRCQCSATFKAKVLARLPNTT
jgi:transcriptional regulator with XRE-family HTH domain